jgi:signal transduction histidine kinase
MAEGKYQERATITTKDEIGELSSDFNRMADALEAHVQHLEDESRQRENFVTSFAHELKTPLTSIIGYADMLRSQKVDEETHFRSANYIFTEGRRLERLSLKLLELMVLNRQEFERYPVNAADVSVRLWETASSALQEKYGVSLSVDLPDATIYIEPDLIQTMLLNLIDNAGKASKEGQRVSVRGKCCPAGYRISVTDQGTGIPAEELSHITEAFYMVDKSRSRAQNGAGLGLALCDAIAKLHQTELTFQSELVKGTTVSVFVPYFMEVGDEEA